MTAQIEQLFIYPVKSCAPIALQSMTLDAVGPLWDRRWMLVTPQGRFLTARKEPRLLQVQPNLEVDALRLEAPGQPPLKLPLYADEAAELRTVKVWSDTVTVPLVEAAGPWFSRYLGYPCELVRIPDQPLRRVDPDWHAGASVGFADGFPLLLTHTASLDALNALLDEPVPMSRFRPNVVISGFEAYAEDQWQRLRLGDLDCAVAKPCSRCVMTTIDPLTLEKSPEPLRTLKQTRLTDLGVLFGQNLVHLTEGQLVVGQAVQPGS